MRMKMAVVLCVFFWGMSLVAGAAAADEPIYDSTADTVFDIIKESDPSALLCLEELGRDARQIWDKRVAGEPIVDAFLYGAHFKDGTFIEIAVNPEFETRERAFGEAHRFAVPLGQLPTLLRKGIARFSVHMGEEGFHAGAGQVVVYSGKADERSRDFHLEESIFHEAVHASLDDELRLSEDWRDAQMRDGRFLTAYGERSPEREDLAETALFAFAILHHPDRFPPADTEATQSAVPNRMNYLAKLFPPGQPLFFEIGPPEDCK